METDHKPLESLATKPIHAVPKRLQRMMLRLPGKIRNQSRLCSYFVECAGKLYHHNRRQLRASAEEVVRKEPKPPTVLLSSPKRHSVVVSRPWSPAEDLPVVTSEHAM